MESDEQIIKKIDQAVTISNKDYNQNKKKAIEFEKTNYNTIALIPSRGSGSWKKFGDHSALIYYYFVLPLFRKKFPTFRPDSDDFNKFEYGVMSVNTASTVYSALIKNNLLKDVKNNDGKVFFVLNVNFDQRQIDLWWKEEQQRRESMNNILVVENCLPEFRQKMRQLAKMVHGAVSKKMRKAEQETSGEDLIRAMSEISRTYYRLMRKFGDESLGAWEDLLARVDDFCAELQIIIDSGIWGYNAGAKIGELVSEMREMVKNEVAIRTPVNVDQK